MAEGLKGVTPEQRQELSTMLERLGALWAELTKAAANQDEPRVKQIQTEIADCRKRVEEDPDEIAGWRKGGRKNQARGARGLGVSPPQASRFCAAVPDRREAAGRD